MLDFIVNPTAGGKAGKKIRKALPEIQKHLIENKVEYAFPYTEYKKQATTLTAELIEKGATTIVVIGGDGTLHEVINGFTDFDKTALGIIPLGTGNDFASALNLPPDPVEALDVIIKGEPKYTDFMQMPTVRGLNIIGMGVDVDVLKRYNKLKKKSKFGYTLSLIKTLFNINYVDFKAEMNGETKDYHSFVACIANGDRYGGGMRVCPPACPYDGSLDFIAVDEINGLKIINALLKLKNGKLLSLKQTLHDKMKEVKIFPNGDYTVNVDGELYENIPFEVKIVSDKLRVYR